MNNWQPSPGLIGFRFCRLGNKGAPEVPPTCHVDHRPESCFYSRSNLDLRTKRTFRFQSKLLLKKQYCTLQICTQGRQWTDDTVLKSSKQYQVTIGCAPCTGTCCLMNFLSRRLVHSTHVSMQSILSKKTQTRH